MNSAIEFCIFELVYVLNFSWNWQFWFFFDQICPKKEFPVENGKIALVCASTVVSCYVKLFRTFPTDTTVFWCLFSSSHRDKNKLRTLLILLTEIRNSHPRCYMKKGVLKNFAKFTEKYLWQSLFFNKVSSLRLIIENKTLAQIFSSEFC